MTDAIAISKKTDDDIAMGCTHDDLASYKEIYYILYCREGQDMYEYSCVGEGYGRNFAEKKLVRTITAYQVEENR